MPEIRWLYPTSTATKAHAFLGSTIRAISSEEQTDVERGLQSLCRKYARFSCDRGTPNHPSAGRACMVCDRKVEVLRG